MRVKPENGEHQAAVNARQRYDSRFRSASYLVFDLINKLLLNIPQGEDGACLRERSGWWSHVQPRFLNPSSGECRFVKIDLMTGFSFNGSPNLSPSSGQVRTREPAYCCLWCGKPLSGFRRILGSVLCSQKCLQEY